MIGLPSDPKVLLLWVCFIGIFIILLKASSKYWGKPLKNVLFLVGYWLYNGRLGYILHLLDIYFNHEKRVRNPHTIAKPTVLSDMTVVPIPSLNDNYSYIVVDTKTKKALAVDVGDPNPVLKYVMDNKLDLTAVLTTHKHWDHAGGNKIIKNNFPNLPIYGGCDEKVLAKTHSVKDNEVIKIGNFSINILATPGHTDGHIVFLVQANQVDPLCVFTGDLLFIGGMGKMFEGPPLAMLKSIIKIRLLPGNSLLFPGHEYSLANLTFATSLLPYHPPVQAKWRQVKRRRLVKLETIPTTVSEELEYNPFMLTHSDMVREALGLPPLTEQVDVLIALRQRKDDFKPITCFP